MFEIELKSPEEFLIKVKDREILINLANYTIDAGLKVGLLEGAGEYEVGDAVITGIALEGGKVMYRADVEGIKLGLVGDGARPEDLDELGPIDVLGAFDTKVVGLVEPKIVIPMGNMDFSTLKGEVKVEKKLKIKNASSLPVVQTVYKLD